MSGLTNAEKILDILHKDCRIPLEQIADMLGESVEVVAEEISKMEEDGVILGYGAKVNWDKAFGSEAVSAYIEIKVTPQRNQGFDRIAERIYQYPEVKAVNLMSGSYDFGITVEGSNVKEIAQFVSDHLAPMDSVISTATHFVLKRYKYDGIICNKPEKDDREVISL